MSRIFLLTGIALGCVAWSFALSGAEKGDRPSPTAHPLGRIASHEAQPRIAVRDFAVPIAYPVFEGERVVLTTVGVEVQKGDQIEFQPLVAVVVDQSFDEAPDGQWLAVWNLGKKSPGFFSRLRASVPALLSRKRSDKGRLKSLQSRLDQVDLLRESGRLKPPRPTYDLTQGYRRSVARLVLGGLKTTLGILDFTYVGQLLFRGYLLRRDDYQDRSFEQTYLGMIWYADLLTARPQGGALSPEDIQDIKFRMLANRNMLGKWVKQEEMEDFVHGFESEMRDHLWGTSNRLAGAANDYHLGYEELQRAAPSGVPLALGGILYYDPALAPAPDQVRWGMINPFDLTYNPFTDAEVLKTAASGHRVPLALYTYQSTLALKPIITVDFFRPKNPKLREAGTYWRRLSNEAVRATNIGLIFNVFNRAFGFLSNRKALSWFSDRKRTLGIEELRLSLLSGLYFEPARRDQLLDRVDRVLVNPLIQASREQRLRARLQHRALLANDGEGVLLAARRLRNRVIRKTFDWRPKPLGPSEYAAYRDYLERHNHLDRLRLYMRESYASSLPAENIEESLQALTNEVDAWDRETVEVLQEFALTLEGRPGLRPEDDRELRRLAQSTESSLKQIYRRAGRSEQDYLQDMESLQLRLREKQEKAVRQRERIRVDFFKRRLKFHIKVLDAFDKNAGDMAVVSPWYLEQAVEFFNQVPEMIATHPGAAKVYAKHRDKVDSLLASSAAHLAESRSNSDSEWLRASRQRCLRRLRDLVTPAEVGDAPTRATRSGGKRMHE